MIDLRLAKDEMQMIVALLKQLNAQQVGSIDVEMLIRYLTNKIESEDDQEGFEAKQEGHTDFSGATKSGHIRRRSKRSKSPLL